MKKISVIWFLCFLCLVSNCQAVKTDQAISKELTQTTTQAAEITDETALSKDAEPVALTKTTAARAVPTKTPMPPPAPTPTVPSWERILPLYSMPLPAAKAAVEELLKTNGGCSLPCWWGIEPGKTSYTDAIDQFSPLSTFIYVKKNDENGSLDAEFQFPVPETNSSREFSIIFTVEKGIVQQIEINPGTVHRFTISQVLNDYGVPEEVWVEGLIDPTSNNPFTLFLYYPGLGIEVTYWVDAVVQGDNLLVCPGSIPPTILVLWKPDGVEDFIGFTKRSYDLSYIKDEKRELIPLEQITSQTLEDISKSGCFKTPKNIWPTR